MDIDALFTKLQASDLPKLWIPAKENFHRIDALPYLGTGKLDLAAIKRLAQSGFPPAGKAPSEKAMWYIQSCGDQRSAAGLKFSCASDNPFKLFFSSLVHQLMYFTASLRSVLDRV